MYEFGKENVMVGMRFYKFISEDEYKIYALIRVVDDNNAIFMDEDDCSLFRITKTDLNNDYTLLIDYMDFTIGFDFDTGEHIDITYVTYKYLRQVIFKKTLNYILKLNNLFISQSDTLDSIWEMYFNRIYTSNSKLILRVNREEDKNVIDLDNVVNGDGRLPDSIFADAEEELSIYILSYEVFEYTDCVNIDNINMMHFFLYDYKNDKYYIVLYIMNTSRESRRVIDDINENIDLWKFMSK